MERAPFFFLTTFSLLFFFLCVCCFFILFVGFVCICFSLFVLLFGGVVCLFCLFFQRLDTFQIIQITLSHFLTYCAFLFFTKPSILLKSSMNYQTLSNILCAVPSTLSLIGYQQECPQDKYTAIRMLHTHSCTLFFYSRTLILLEETYFVRRICICPNFFKT